MGGDKAKQGAGILNIYVLNTCYIPSHILCAGERAANKMGKSLCSGGIRNRHLISCGRKSTGVRAPVFFFVCLYFLLIYILVGRH